MKQLFLTIAPIFYFLLGVLLMVVFLKFMPLEVHIHPAEVRTIETKTLVWIPDQKNFFKGIPDCALSESGQPCWKNFERNILDLVGH